MAVTPEIMKAYGYGDDTNWQAAIAELCIAAAKAYMAKGGASERTNDAEYDLGVLMLATHWYDNRGVQTIGMVGADVAMGVNSIILQLASTPVATTTPTTP